MCGVRSCRRDKVTDEEIVGYVRRWTRTGGRVTTKMMSEKFGFALTGMLARLNRIPELSRERLTVLGNVWSVKD